MSIRADQATLAASLAAILASIVIAVASSITNAPYYLSSVAIIICSMIPFFVAFEARRPKAREIVLLAVMCALAVASRIVFAWAPGFKPTAAIVMISGLALGAQSGFLTGVIAMLASNFLFGQGYWTPWQMIAFGLAGFVFGLFSNSKVIAQGSMRGRNVVVLALCGALFILVVVGPILDTSSLFMFMRQITFEGAVAVYAAGISMNAAHAAATFITLLLIANPILKKIHRVKSKYGMV